MRKKIIDSEKQKVASAGQGGINLESMAHVELTSEDENHPIEAAFASTDDSGWKAAQPGEQTIRIFFDEPQNIRSIKLLFREEDRERIQEFVLRWLPSNENMYQEIVRQQYNFSPPHTTEESETYTVALEAVKAIELTIIPDKNGSAAYASLAQFQVNGEI